MIIISDKKSDYKIVYSSLNHIANYTAAKELQENLNSVFQFELPILDETKQSVTGKFISLGNTELLGKSGITFDYSALNSDGFIIREVDGNIYVNGFNARGVLYGVYDLLEKYAGVRFISAETTYLPKREIFEIPERLSITDKPDFMLRHFLAGDIWLGNEDPYMQKLACRMRMSHEQQGTPEEYGGGPGWYKDNISLMHNTLEYAPPEKYAEKYPQMYYFRDGAPIELCLSDGITENGEIDFNLEMSSALAVLQSLKENILKDPSAEFFMIGQMDWPAKACECGRCRANLEKYKTRSGIAIVFFNAVVREINEWAKEQGIGREIKIIIFAYNYTQQAPVVKDGQTGKYEPVSPLVVTDNRLYIRIAPFIYNYAISVGSEKQERRLQEIYESWASMTGNLMVWDYLMNTDENFYYMPYLKVMQENYKYYLKHNVKYAMTQCVYTDTNNFQTKMMLYIASKLMWNTEADFDSVFDEYMTLEYGVMKEDVLRYMKLMDEMYEKAFKEYPDIQITPAQRNNAYYEDPVTFEKAYILGGVKIAREAIEKLEKIRLPDKETMRKKMYRILLMALRMNMRNVSMYPAIYDQTPEEVRSIIEEYFKVCDYLGVKQHSSGVPLEALKTVFGIK